MFCKRAGLLLVLSLISSCGRPSKRPFDRAAIPPLENLTSVEQLDWVGRAAPYVITSAVMGTAGSLPLPVESARDAGAHRATQVLHGRYTLEGSTLRIHASVRDVPANRTVRDVEAAGPVEDVVPLLEKVSAALTTQPVRSHGNRKAVEAFGRSLLTRDPAEKLAYAGQAVEADPRFGFAVLTAAQIHVSQGKPQAAREVLERGLPQQPEGWMRARFREVLGSLEANAPAVFEAIRQELRFSPNNTDRMRQLADALLSRRQYAEAASWYQKAAALEPDQTQLWNLLSYTHAYARNFEAASASLASYRKSASADPNAYDTSGEILLMAGRFAEAEKYFLEAQRKDPQFLGGLEFSKAAFARFLSGDAVAADLIFGRYLESRRAAQDPLADLRHAHWLYLTGRREQAIERMREAAGRQGDAASRANAFLGLWLVEQGRHVDALQAAKRAAALAKTPASLTAAALCAFLAQPPAPAEQWQSRLDRAITGNAPPQWKRSMLIYPLFLSKQYPAASRLLEAAFLETQPAGADELRMLLGGAKALTGDAKAAVPLLANYPLPPQPGEAMFASLYFPVFREWRAAVGIR